MPRYIAFLRAINVGGHTVKMDHLRKLFEDIGLSKVETFIASGNVIFDSKSKNTQALERKIENHLKQVLGYEVATFVREKSELAGIASYKPFRNSELSSDNATLYIGFVPVSPSEQTRQNLLSCSTEVDSFHINGREVYWLCRTKLGESQFSGALLEKILGMRVTMRNSNTVRRIALR